MEGRLGWQGFFFLSGWSCEMALTAVSMMSRLSCRGYGYGGMVLIDCDYPGSLRGGGVEALDRSFAVPQEF